MSLYCTRSSNLPRRNQMPPLNPFAPSSPLMRQSYHNMGFSRRMTGRIFSFCSDSDKRGGKRKPYLKALSDYSANNARVNTIAQAQSSNLHLSHSQHIWKRYAPQWPSQLRRGCISPLELNYFATRKPFSTFEFELWLAML